MRSGGRCEACGINVAGSQGLIWKAHRHAASTLAPGASRADYKAAYASFFERNPKPEVARLAPFVRLRKETKQIQRGSLLQADHILAVCLDGGSCGLENMQSLCSVCHNLKTAADKRKVPPPQLPQSQLPQLPQPQQQSPPAPQFAPATLGVAAQEPAPVAAQEPAPVATEPLQCKFCTRTCAPGTQRNGRPWQTCCKLCGVAAKPGYRGAHSLLCEHRANTRVFSG